MPADLWGLVGFGLTVVAGGLLLLFAVLGIFVEVHDWLADRKAAKRIQQLGTMDAPIVLDPDAVTELDREWAQIVGFSI
jgi:hypothetical protein